MTEVQQPTGWWEQALENAGVQSMEMLLAPDATWEEVLESGRADLKHGLYRTRYRPQPHETAIDLGCGIGRITQALAFYFERVVGLEISASLLNEARQRNHNPAVSFEQIDGCRLHPLSIGNVDVVFSYEVLYLIPPTVLAVYFRDIWNLLVPGGAFLFQMNLHPIRWKTRVAREMRDMMHTWGIENWNGWPTDPRFRRYYYKQTWVTQQLTSCGFQIERIDGENLKQTWFTARKPVLASP